MGLLFYKVDSVETGLKKDETGFFDDRIISQKTKETEYVIYTLFSQFTQAIDFSFSTTLVL